MPFALVVWSVPCFYFPKRYKEPNKIRKLKEINVKAFDLVELCPDYDATGITSFMAWEVLNNFLSFGYNKKEK